MKHALIASAIVLVLLTACTLSDEDASMIVNHTIEKTLKQPSSWHGSFIVRNEGGGSLIHTTYNGVHNDDGYRVAIDTQGMGFDSQAEVKKEDGELYVKLPKSSNWQKTSPRDLKMLGLGFANSPIEFAKKLRELDLIIQTTDRKNVYKIIVKDDRDLPVTDKVIEVTGTDEATPVDPPEIFVEVNPKNQTIRSLGMYIEYTDGSTLLYDIELSRKE